MVTTANTFNTNAVPANTAVTVANTAVSVKNSQPTVKDSSATISMQCVSLANEPPVAEDDAFITDEDSILTVDPPGVLLNDSDGDGDTLQAMLISPTSSGELSLHTDGSFTYQPDPDFHGQDSFTYEAFDGVENSNTATVTITVNPLNDDPLALNDTASASQNTPIVIDVLSNDNDVDGDPLTVSSFDVLSPNGGVIIDSGDGTLTYTPPPGSTGTDTFQYTISDGNGGSDGATVTVTVTE
jgi:VCBS repeat-containing protein